MNAKQKETIVTMVKNLKGVLDVSEESALERAVSMATYARKLILFLEDEKKKANVEAQDIMKANRVKFALLDTLKPEYERVRNLIRDAMVPNEGQNEPPLELVEGSKGGGAKLKELWDYEITDVEEFYKNHSQYFIVDDKALRADIRRKKDPVRSLRGVRIFDRKQLEIVG